MLFWSWAPRHSSDLDRIATPESKHRPQTLTLLVDMELRFSSYDHDDAVEASYWQGTMLKCHLQLGIFIVSCNAVGSFQQESFALVEGHIRCREAATALFGGNRSIFMCKLCNLFSPNRSELLGHVSEKHAEEGITADDIIIPLRPLTTPSNLNKSGEDVYDSMQTLKGVWTLCALNSGPQVLHELLVVKRRRGRPKGSTKKFCADEELVECNTSVQNEEPPPGPEGVGGSQAEVLPGNLACGKCNWKFSNSRQLRKHICIIVKHEDLEDEGDPGNDSEADLDRREEEREKASKRPRLQRTEKSLLAKDPDQVSGAKNPIISVVLTAHEAIPGATKIVPVEAASPENEPETSASDSLQRRGYQEYAIQQTPYEQPMKSSRLGSTQLKIFTCQTSARLLQATPSTIKANLNVHLRKHTGEKFSCECCPFTCLSKGHLKVHVERVHKKIKQHCRFCKKKYSDVKNLIKHIKEAHDLQDPKVKDVFDELRLMTREGKRQLLYDCHICERKFKNELDRDRHMLVHGDERPFACELCGHGATKYQALELHVRKHPFVYVCSECSKKFVSSIRLRAHIKEAHKDLPESPLFNSSINQSFCLLEPGGDIQQEALGEQLSQTAAELSFLNSKVLCIPKKTIEPDNPEGSHPDGSRDNLATAPLELPGPDPPCQPPTESPSPDGCAQSASDVFLLKTAPEEEKSLLGEGEDTSHEPSVEVQCESADVNRDAQDPRGTPDPAENGQTSGAPGQEDGATTLETAETSNPLPLLESSAAAGENAESSAPSSDHRTGAAAFMQILDSLQKRQMNTTLCEKIRKVYGDLECEYCGNINYSSVTGEVLSSFIFRNLAYI
uniref:Uncharacterized protein n=1 Tax=Sphaerodactylus townsendi TaxID=933632 RepID=A0ACB8FEV4_9SAUR